jgi:hypothetical protein
MAVVFEEILGSATVHEMREPAGMRCSPALAKSGAENTRDRRAKQVFFITILLVCGLWREVLTVQLKAWLCAYKLDR